MGDVPDPPDGSLPIQGVAPLIMDDPLQHARTLSPPITLTGLEGGRKGPSYLRAHNAAEESYKFKRMDKQVRLGFEEESSDEETADGTIDPPGEPSREWINEHVKKVKEMCSSRVGVKFTILT